nr:histidine-type phosphatase [Dysgonomonas macrotermitis]
MVIHSFFSALVLLSLFVSPSLSAQNSKSDKFKENYELKEVVVLSRHNIRAPLSGKNSILGKITTHEWTNWTANASELTLRGGVLETMMGQYFRKWLEDEGLFKEGYCPNTDEVNIYANSMQRTVATAEYFQSGFSPTCNRNFYHRFTPSKMDPLFFPRLTKVSEEFKAQALKEISAMGGTKGIVGINESLKASYDLIERVTDMKNSPACKEGNTCALNDYNTQLTFKLGDEPNMAGSLKIANTIADALILQYFEEPDDKKAAFGNDLTVKDWENISKIKDVYGDVLFAAPIVATNVAHPLLVYLKDELNSNARKFTFLVGHDSNICSVTNALQFEEYSLPNTIEKKTPIGSKLVFEKWQDKRTKKEYISVNLVYQTTDQLRKLLLLNLDNPPASFQMKISGLTANEFGLYNFDDVVGRFDQAITAYEAIK